MCQPFWCWSRNILDKLDHVPSQRAHDAIMTSLWRQNDVATSFWRHNEVIFASCVPCPMLWLRTLAHHCRTWSRIYGTCVISVLHNDGKCKYISIFLKRNRFFIRVWLWISRRWFRWWFSVEQARSQYMNQCWPSPVRPYHVIDDNLAPSHYLLNQWLPSQLCIYIYIYIYALNQPRELNGYLYHIKYGVSSRQVK